MKYYEDLHATAQTALHTAFADPTRKALLSSCHNFTLDLEDMAEVVSPNFASEKFLSAAQEAQCAIYLAIIGLRKQSYASLRYVLERTLAAILLSANELKYRQWVGGSDLTWSAINGDESGVFSTSFVKAFLPDAKDEAAFLQRMASAVYRECSEYVHGNYSIASISQPIIKLDEEALGLWLEKFDVVQHVIFNAFAIRFCEELKNSPESRIFVAIEDSLSSKQYIRDALYG